MKVKNKVSGAIVEMTEELFQRNKKFFSIIVEEEIKSKKVRKKKKDVEVKTFEIEQELE